MIVTYFSKDELDIDAIVGLFQLPTIASITCNAWKKLAFAHILMKEKVLDEDLYLLLSGALDMMRADPFGAAEALGVLVVSHTSNELWRQFVNATTLARLFALMDRKGCRDLRHLL